MKKTRTRLWSILLTVAMLLTLLPTTALAGEGDVAQVGDATYATLQNAIEAANTSGGTITLLDDITLDSTLVLSGSTIDITIDLAQHTLSSSVQDDALSIKLEDGAALTVKNGQIEANDYEESYYSVIAVNTQCSLTLDNVEFNSTGTPLAPSGDAAEVNVINHSVIIGGAYCVATNASTSGNYGVEINLENSDFSGASTVFLNVPGTLHMNNCTVFGTMHGVVVRGGTAEIRNCQITLEYPDDDAEAISKYFDNQNWGSGNMLNLAALTMGNKNPNAYQYPTDVTLVRTTLKSVGEYADLFPAVYAWANSDPDNGVTVSYDNCTINGAVVYGNDGNNIDATIVNGPVKDDSGNYYFTLADAVAAVIDSDTKTGTVTLLDDCSGAGIGLFNTKGATDVELTIDFGGYTYTCEDPAVGSTGTESQGFHLEKGNTVTLKNGAIVVDEDSTDTQMLIQNYCDLTLEDLTLEGGPVTQYIISSNYGDVIAENISIDGSYGPGMVAIDLMHWLNESYKDKAPTLVLRNTDANTISGSIEVYCYGTGAGTCAEKPQLTISGGYFTADPSDYVADGYTVLPSDKSGYDWMVAQEGSNPADVAAGWLHMSNNVDKDASDMESKAAGELLNKMVGSDLINNDLSDYAEILANQNTVTAEQGKAALEAAGISTEGKTVSVYIMPVTRATLDDVVLAEGSTLNALKVNAFTMSFAVKFYTVATTVADGGDILLPEFASADDEVNAVTVGDPQAWPPTWTEITIPLDEIFQIPAGDLYIFDLDNDATYRSSATDRKLTFTAPEGLSTFVIAPTENWNTDTHAVRYVVEDVSYPTEVERVAHGEKITYTPTRAGYAFLGWYTDPELTEAWNMAKDTVTENITLYAKWAAVRPPEGVDKIEVSTGGAVIDEEDAPEGAGEVLDALKGNNGVQQAGTGITDAAENVATSGTVITDEVVEEAKKELNVAEGITITVETYLVVKVTEAADESFTLDITPMYQLKATAEDEEPVDIGEPQKLTVTGSVTLSIPLPSGFADAAENLFVRHMKGGVTYVYEGARSSDGNLLTFTNPHGFSAFTVTTEGYVAKIEDEDFGYTDFQNAVDEVKNGQTITVYASDLSAKVSGDKTFYVEMDEGITVYPNLTAADGYVLVTEETADSRLQVTVYPKRDTSSGSGSSGGTAPVRDITVDSGSHGDVEVSPEEAKPTTTITITVTPDKGYAVAEVVVTAENGKEITVTDKGNGKYTFSMPNSDVTIEVTFQPVSGGAAGSDLTITAPTGWVNPFTDVASNAWYYDAVGYANANGLMGGTSATTFAPNGAMNRSMVWTVIARLAGQTISGATWAEDAKAWAVAQGVSDGTNPDGNVTREELVTMLYRYIGSPVMNVPELGLINSYPDAASVSDWAQDAFAWALSRGIIDGRDGKLASGESVTRAEAATILARFHLLTK